MSFVKMAEATPGDYDGTVFIPKTPPALAAGHVTQETRSAQAEAAERAKSRGGETEEEVHATLASGQIVAKYKIEITFTYGRTVNGPNKLGIQIWESGKHFHGGGDELIFFCKDVSKDSDNGCWGVIPSNNVRGGVAYCPSCERAVNANLLTNMKIGNVTSQNLAVELTRLFRELGSNADIYLKYHKTDIHYVAMERAKGPDVAARLKGMHIYTLKNIIKDTSSGADLTKRFLAFVRS